MASKDNLGRREQKVQERLEAQRRAAKAGRTKKYALIGTAAVLVAVLVAALIIANKSQPATSEGIHFNDPTTAAGKLYEHVPFGQPTNYDHHPPAYGNHYPEPAAWGISDVALPEGTFVHNLEHGGIVILYHCPSGCQDTVAQLKTLMSQLPKDPQFGEVKAVLSPYEQDSHLITVLAWDWELDLDSFDANTIRNFYQTHVDKSPEKTP